VETAAASSVKDAGTDTGAVFGIIGVLAVLVAGGGFLATRKKASLPPIG
jgi:LPXTG-motif cell wall-anchored protein